MAEGKIGEFT